MESRLSSDIINNLNVPTHTKIMLTKLFELTEELGMKCNIVYSGDKRDIICLQLIHRGSAIESELAEDPENNLSAILLMLRFFQKLQPGFFRKPKSEGNANLQAEIMEIKERLEKLEKQQPQTTREPTLEERVKALNLRAIKMLGGGVRFSNNLHKRITYFRSGDYLNGTKVFTIANALVPKQPHAGAGQRWFFELDELDDLEAFIEHDEEIWERFCEKCPEVEGGDSGV